MRPVNHRRLEENIFLQMNFAKSTFVLHLLWYCVANALPNRIAVPVSYAYSTITDLDTSAAEQRSLTSDGVKHLPLHPLPLLQTHNVVDSNGEANSKVHTVKIFHQPSAVSYNLAKGDLNPSASYHVSEEHESDHGSYSSHDSGK